MPATRVDKEEVQRAIGHHLAHGDGGGWDTVRSRYPDVPAATFWRWVRALRDKPSADQVQAARTLLTGVPGAGLPADAALPAPVAMSAVAADGRRARAQINFFLELQQLMDDARLLRTFALTPCGSRVRNPRVLADSAKLRSQFLQLYLNALPQLYAAEQTQKLYLAIVDAVAACEPEAARTIIQKMRALSAEAGFLT